MLIKYNIYIGIANQKSALHTYHPSNFSSISPWHHGGFRRIVAEVVINTHHEAWLKEHYDGSKYLVERGITMNGAKRMK